MKIARILRVTHCSLPNSDKIKYFRNIPKNLETEIRGEQWSLKKNNEKCSTT